MFHNHTDAILDQFSYPHFVPDSGIDCYDSTSQESSPVAGSATTSGSSPYGTPISLPFPSIDEGASPMDSNLTSSSGISSGIQLHVQMVPVKVQCSWDKLLARDPGRHKIAREIFKDIGNSKKILPPRVNGLVCCDNYGLFHCPLSDCLDKFNGWTSRVNARDHIWAVHFGGRFLCPQCNTTFGTKNDFIVHMDASHSDTPKVFPCLQCSRSFPKKFNLNRHLKIHSRALSSSTPTLC